MDKDDGVGSDEGDLRSDECDQRIEVGVPETVSWWVEERDWGWDGLRRVEGERMRLGVDQLKLRIEKKKVKMSICSFSKG